MKKLTRDRVIDILLICLMIVPLLLCIILRILTKPATEGISITGAQIYFTIPMPLMDWPITEAQVTSVAVLLTALGLCLFLTRNMKLKPTSKRQIIAEWAVEKVNNLVSDNMGERFLFFGPFVGAILAISALSSLTSLLGLFPPTSDMNIVLGWALLCFGLITYYKLQGGVWPYIKGFLEPIPVFAPFNIVGEFATPISMSFRHYGNVMSGMVIATLIAYALQNLSNMVLGWLPGFLRDIAFLQIGIPAILSFYFDVFSGCLQAFIFSMLTMLYIANGAPEEA